MRVEVIGEATILPAEDIAYAMSWFANRLMPDDAAGVSLDVHLAYDGMGIDMALIRPLERPSSFALHLNMKRIVTTRSMILCLAHESVHVWQYATKILRQPDGGCGYTIWRGEEVDDRDFWYADLPWEVEAYRMEKFLYDEYVQHLRDRSRKSPRPRREPGAERRAEVIRGKKWLTVVLLLGGQARMAVPARTEERADAISRLWLAEGKFEVSHHNE